MQRRRAKTTTRPLRPKQLQATLPAARFFRYSARRLEFLDLYRRLADGGILTSTECCNDTDRTMRLVDCSTGKEGQLRRAAAVVGLAALCDFLDDLPRD